MVAPLNFGVAVAQTAHSLLAHQAMLQEHIESSDDDTVYATASVGERMLIFMVYLVLLGGIAGVTYYFIRQGDKRIAKELNVLNGSAQDGTCVPVTDTNREDEKSGKEYMHKRTVSGERPVTRNYDEQVTLMTGRLITYLSQRDPHPVSGAPSCYSVCDDGDRFAAVCTSTSVSGEHWSDYGPSRPPTPLPRHELDDRPGHGDHALFSPLILQLLLIFVLLSLVLVSLPMDNERELQEIRSLYNVTTTQSPGLDPTHRRR